MKKLFLMPISTNIYLSVDVKTWNQETLLWTFALKKLHVYGQLVFNCPFRQISIDVKTLQVTVFTSLAASSPEQVVV